MPLHIGLPRARRPGPERFDGVMPRTPAPLPVALPPILLPSDLTPLGISVERLRRGDVAPVERGLHAVTGRPVTAWTDLGLGEPGHGRSPEHLAALLRRRPGAVLSHTTAAHLHGLPTPGLPASADDEPVHLTLPRGTRRIRRADSVDHRRPLPAAHVEDVHGLRVTTIERTWLDLCSLGGTWSVPHLVAAGDHAVRHPWTPEGRRPPATTIGRLVRTAADVRGFHGSRRARTALGLVRVGADSPPETFLRLALADAGLPEPELQAPIDPADPRSPEADLAYRTLRLCLQYDGAGHRTPEQQTRDARRERYAAARGWATLRATRDDLRDGFVSLVGEVRRRHVEATASRR